LATAVLAAWERGRLKTRSSALLSDGLYAV